MELFQTSLVNIKNLGDNDIYRWYLASLGHAVADSPDLKLTLMFPCTDLHIKKYSPQLLRMVTETPKIYKDHVRPYMQKKREEGRLNWVFNILEGRSEQEDVMLRDLGQGANPDDGFLLMPDMNWDRQTLTSLRLLALVERRDIWSLRDLRKSHVDWLKHMREKILDATMKLYSEIDRDMLKLYVHCSHLSILPTFCDHETYLSNRPANILPPSHSRRAHYARSRQYPSHRQSVWARKHHLPARDSIRRYRR